MLDVSPESQRGGCHTDFDWVLRWTGRCVIEDVMPSFDHDHLND